MTDKSKRQRGSRTHGGGSQKNRRGAGHRGGRGAAGRDKHEHHNHPPLGKHGFDRPEAITDDVATVELRELDEDAPLLAADGLAEETEAGYRIDARELIDEPVDRIKVLGGGQVRRELTVVADAFSESARERLAAAGGEAIAAETDSEPETEPTADA